MRSTWNVEKKNQDVDRFNSESSLYDQTISGILELLNLSSVHLRLTLKKNIDRNKQIAKLE